MKTIVQKAIAIKLNQKKHLQQTTKMKTILALAFMTISQLGFCQIKFYEEDGKKIAVSGEKTTLTFTKGNDIETVEVTEENGFVSPFLAAVGPSVIKGIFDITTDLIEKNLKTFTSEFTARNTYLKDKKYVSGFKILREIQRKDSVNKETAFELEFVPVKVGEKFVYAVHKIDLKKSGARSIKEKNLNDYAIEIKVTFYNGDEKKEQTSAPISLSLVSINSTLERKDLVDAEGQYLFVSDKFPLNTKWEISEVSVKIIETNTAKVNAEKIKSISDKYSDDVQETANTIFNLYIEDSKDEDAK